MDYPTLPYEEIDAIVAGYHGDPFAILGPHPYEDGVVVRAFLPLADSVEVMISSQKTFPMEKVKVDGFFEVILPDQSLPLTYLLKTKTYDGKVVLYEDSYTFPSTRSEFDAHLLAEGTHTRIYEKLGAHLTELNGSEGVLFAVWGGRNQGESVAMLAEKYKAWCKTNKPKNQLQGEITKERLRTSANWPKFKAKAAQLRSLAPFALYLAEKHLDRRYQLIIKLLCRYYQVLEI